LESLKAYLLRGSLGGGNSLYCLYCQVDSVPLAAIRDASLGAERLLCIEQDWLGGLAAARACQVMPLHSDFSIVDMALPGAI
jgi:hypothetical protein